MLSESQDVCIAWKSMRVAKSYDIMRCAINLQHIEYYQQACSDAVIEPSYYNSTPKLCTQNLPLCQTLCKEPWNPRLPSMQKLFLADSQLNQSVAMLAVFSAKPASHHLPSLYTTMYPERLMPRQSHMPFLAALP